MNYLISALAVYLSDRSCYFVLNVCGVVNLFKILNYKIRPMTLIILISEKAKFGAFGQKQFRRVLVLYQCLLLCYEQTRTLVLSHSNYDWPVQKRFGNVCQGVCFAISTLPLVQGEYAVLGACVISSS